MIDKSIFEQPIFEQAAGLIARFHAIGITLVPAAHGKLGILLHRDAPEDDLPPADADELRQPLARHVTLAGVDEETFRDLSNELSTVPGLYAEVRRVLIEGRGMTSLSRRNRR